MPFLNIPLKSIQVQITSVSGTESMPWNNPLQYPVIPPALPPAPEQKDYRWRVTMDIESQLQSSYLTRQPGTYTGMDVAIGQWIANSATGQAWQIISIESKTDSSITAIVQDVYRYNTFRNPAQTGAGNPATGVYITFSVGDAGIPQIDPIPSAGISSSFTQNLNSRFEYINLQYDYPLYQLGNAFAFNDVISVNPDSNSFVLADATYKTVIGRVTSISDTLPDWFTINPVQKIVDFLDELPGGVGSIIYSSTTTPGGLTTLPDGSPIYIKLRDQTSSITTSTTTGPTTAGNVFQLNGVDITVGGTGTAADVISAVTAQAANTGVTTATILSPAIVQTNNALITTTYGEPALFAASAPATATINGSLVTFNILSTDPGYEDYSRAAQMAQAINNANIPNIVASTPSALSLQLTNTIGGTITIVNGTSDINGVPFAGPNSGSGLALSTAASTTSLIRFTADDSRAINFLNVVGTTLEDFGLISVENGVKAAGLYIEGGLRTASSTVVSDLTQLNTLVSLIGDQAYVIDSDDGNGNNVGEWSMWIYDGLIWVQTSSQDSASTDARSLEFTVQAVSPASTDIGRISTGRRVSLITVEVITGFNGTAPTLSVGFQVNNPVPPAPEPSGLMSSDIIDLTVPGTYTTSTDILFGTDTPDGDVTVTAAFVSSGSTVGTAQIIVSYI